MHASSFEVMECLLAHRAELVLHLQVDSSRDVRERSLREEG